MLLQRKQTEDAVLESPPEALRRLTRERPVARLPGQVVVLVQTLEDSGPFGAKAIAEIPKDGVVPAIRNAIVNATGVRINTIPFTPERVWAALNAD